MQQKFWTKQCIQRSYTFLGQLQGQQWILVKITEEMKFTTNLMYNFYLFNNNIIS
jgi:hypothetical protein